VWKAACGSRQDLRSGTSQIGHHHALETEVFLNSYHYIYVTIQPSILLILIILLSPPADTSSTCYHHQAHSARCPQHRSNPSGRSPSSCRPGSERHRRRSGWRRRPSGWSTWSLRTGMCWRLCRRRRRRFRRPGGR